MTQLKSLRPFSQTMFRAFWREWLRRTPFWSESRARNQSAPRARPWAEALEVRCLPTIYTVITAADGGPGSLRDAINGVDFSDVTRIEFDIPGPGPHTIRLQDGLGSLPRITKPVDINGQAGVELDGSALGEHLTQTASGFEFDVSVTDISTVSGLAIYGFPDEGILIDPLNRGGLTIQNCHIGINAAGDRAILNPYKTPDDGILDDDGVPSSGMSVLHNVISGNKNHGVEIPRQSAVLIDNNFIGTDATGTRAIGNGGDGIILFNGSSGITIRQNVISGNQHDGIDILGNGTNGNHVEGNFIGTDVTGTMLLGNAADGVLINNASNNTVGGTTSQARNIISGNQTDGVAVAGSNATGNLVQGNYVGTDSTGMVAIGNAQDPDPTHEELGVRVGLGAAHGNTVTGNVISGNLKGGVSLDNGAFANTVSANLIGTDPSGMAALGNNRSGLVIQGNAHDNLVQGNVISGNQIFGVTMGGTNGVIHNLLTGNFIGTNITGTAALGNGIDGVSIYVPNNTVGGATSSQRNVISGNGQDGVEILGGGSIGNSVVGNYIGTDVTGTVALPNRIDGVGVGGGAHGNTIGGTLAGMRNVISGNGTAGVGGSGIFFHDSGTNGNRVEGNLIGTDLTGTNALANAYQGVAIANGASGNFVGGTAAGARNVISGNTLDGVFINGSGASSNLVQGNYIGTDINGAASLGNGANGVDLFLGASNNTIGGTPGAARNIISGNLGSGVVFQIGNTTGNVAQGNYIGLDVTGSFALGNGQAGVGINSVSGNTVGGTAAGARNIISGNLGNSVVIFGGSTGNDVQGNYIGTDVSGTHALGNGFPVFLGDVGTMNNLIGGPAPRAGNLISGNELNGVSITNGASNNFVQGNTIGIDVSGSPLGNGTYGVYIHNGASGNIIGGTAQGAGNVIAANTLDGVYISDSGTTGNLVQGNYIGGNGANGVSLGNGASNTTIGGTADGASNTIAFNGNDGVLIDSGTGNAVLHNSIFGNSNLGIELLNGGNNQLPAPQLTSAVAGGGVTTVQGTFTGQALTTYTLEFYAADSSGQGQQFLGSVTVTTDENGVATFSVDLAGELPFGQLVTATATDPNNNTSEFSQAVAVGV